MIKVDIHPYDKPVESRPIGNINFSDCVKVEVRRNGSCYHQGRSSKSKHRSQSNLKKSGSRRRFGSINPKYPQGWD